MRRIKQYLMLLTAVGVIAVGLGGSGTFASFNAQVTNPGNTFAAGTLFLHDNGGTTTCTSESGTMNVNPGTGTGGNACDVLFNADISDPAGTTAQLTLSNAGTIPASDIQFKVGGCTIGDNFANTSVHTVFGSAPTCGQMWITIQETQVDFSTPVYCAYGTNSAGSCAAPSVTYTFANSTSFANLKTTAAANATFTASGGATDTRYYVIKIVPGGVTQDNSLQNRAVTFDLSWNIDQ